MRRWVHRYVWRAALDEGFDAWVVFRVKDDVNHPFWWTPRPLVLSAGLGVDGTAAAARLPVTESEHQRWDEAATRYLSALSAVGLALQRAGERQRRWGWFVKVPRLGAWLARMLRDARDRSLAQARAARATYQPVQDELQRRWDEHMAAEQARREQADQRLRRLEREQEQRRQHAREVYDTWRREREASAAAAEAPVWLFLAEGARAKITRLDQPAESRSARLLTAYELALELAELNSVRLVEWDLGARAAVEATIGPGTFTRWWAGVDATARNVRARNETHVMVVDTIERVFGLSRKLETLGSSGSTSDHEIPSTVGCPRSAGRCARCQRLPRPRHPWRAAGNGVRGLLTGIQVGPSPWRTA